ncbi:MAG: YqaE/Pmp3 family membrane protein [Chitinophagaceae bacterium]|jgi:ABC-type iron transport system FetAB permease component|nr:MAG: YqaE/Pmp3 family membrane protein [Chitinophagaceae bacterium]
MILIAILFPGLSFLLRGKIISAVIAMILQIIAVFFFLVFGIGALLWVILAIWAIASYNEAKKEKRHKQVLKVLRGEKAK